MQLLFDGVWRDLATQDCSKRHPELSVLCDPREVIARQRELGRPSLITVTVPLDGGVGVTGTAVEL